MTEGAEGGGHRLGLTGWHVWSRERGAHGYGALSLAGSLRWRCGVLQDSVWLEHACCMTMALRSRSHLMHGLHVYAAPVRHGMKRQARG